MKRSCSVVCQTLFLVSKTARKNQEQSLTPSLSRFSWWQSPRFPRVKQSSNYYCTW
jgi:hypothetical protein